MPTGISVTSTAERSQLRNRKNALMKLSILINQLNAENYSQHLNSAWQEHTKIVRGNAIRTYEGIHFKRKA